MELTHQVEAAIGVVVVVILLTALAPTISSNTDTSLNSTGGTLGATAGPLVNVSSTAKPIYNLTDLLWAALVIIVVVGFGYNAVKGKKD